MINKKVLMTILANKELNTNLCHNWANIAAL